VHCTAAADPCDAPIHASVSCAADTNRLKELEMQLFGQCSVPLGFDALTMTGRLSMAFHSAAAA
jgi:hypothetical protein